MALASPMALLDGRPLRDDIMNPRHAAAARPRFGSPNGSGIDKDADTVALGRDIEETTRTVSRDEMMRHQDAHVVVGQDAMGDEATLAVAPGALNLGLGEGGIAAALAETLKKRESQSHLDAPAFPAPPQHFQQNVPPPGGGSSGHLQAAHPHGQGHGQPPQSWGDAPPSYQNPPHHQGMPQGFDPMLPQSVPGHAQQTHGGYPQSGNQPIQQTQPVGGGAQQQGYGQNANAQFPPGGGYQQPMQQQHGGAGQMSPAPWMTQQTPPPAGMAAPSRFTPQVILLVAVGAVCLAIFVIGIVLFVTTKF